MSTEKEIASILDSVKKKLGLEPSIVTEFDPDIIDAINMALNTLTELGVGPNEGFMIHDNTSVWEDFAGSNERILGMVRTYVFISTKLVFDPPQSSFVLTNLQEKAKELEWRINVFVESIKTFPPIN